MASRPTDRLTGHDMQERFAPIEIVRPVQWSAPFIFASPHSGRRYPAAFLKDSVLDLHTLRRSEDSYVDLLVDMVPGLGAPFLKALFPRAFVDVNRAANELDPLIFAEQLSSDSDTRSNRVLAGFGVIPRLAADGLSIYRKKLPLSESERRLQHYYRPYHVALQELIDESMDRFGCAILIDCHSMPSRHVWNRQRKSNVDFVLGDRYGASCSPALVSLVQGLLNDQGYAVAQNAPYAGGHVTQYYGNPAGGVHVLQIEINRSLYLDEARITRTAGFTVLRSALTAIFADFLKIDPGALTVRQAAE
ncbi:N-formylglutamate amidohydrolase [Aquisalinus flavus]|uniref:N-formylglutamate amidohydrolase n=1 Tax=Aquisalinus flavus TaxID=1526572 RepID=A0A8J2V4J8_9PROT|nr:N-formylglutamate amidohydrolase [Aquisalinus flavus]MBD0426937.1 N-formylglutamate amidohydrolase [Aquisalinus flavus]UNE46778.1 N-formylglutamate amidohydrolase [Aquisalinus flavus]GGC97104.1 N-formylglutamate amidohydrolase [Aquisalinus flavus]